MIAGNLVSYFQIEENNKKLDHLISHLTIEKEKAPKDQTFEGMTFVITGSLEHFPTETRQKLS